MAEGWPCPSETLPSGAAGKVISAQCGGPYMASGITRSHRWTAWACVIPDSLQSFGCCPGRDHDHTAAACPALPFQGSGLTKAGNEPPYRDRLPSVHSDLCPDVWRSRRKRTPHSLPPLLRPPWLRVFCARRREKGPPRTAWARPGFGVGEGMLCCWNLPQTFSRHSSPLHSPLIVHLSSPHCCGPNRLTWAVARRTGADSSPAVHPPPPAPPPAVHLEMLFAGHQCVCSGPAAPRLISRFSPGACISDSSKLFTGVSHQALCYSKYKPAASEQSGSQPTFFMLLQIERQIKG